MVSPTSISLTTPRLILSAWQPNDLTYMIRMNEDPQVMRHFPNTLSPEQSKETLDRQVKLFEKHGFGFFKATLRQGGSFLGFVGIQQVNFEAHFTPNVEIGWRLMPEAWGKGYATEGGKACLALAFEQLHLPEIVSFTATTNLPSMAVMKRLGMQADGEFNHPALAAGHPLERHVLYRIRAEEWRKGQKG